MSCQLSFARLCSLLRLYKSQTKCLRNNECILQHQNHQEITHSYLVRLFITLKLTPIPSIARRPEDNKFPKLLLQIHYNTWKVQYEMTYNSSSEYPSFGRILLLNTVLNYTDLSQLTLLTHQQSMFITENISFVKNSSTRLVKTWLQSMN